MNGPSISERPAAAGDRSEPGHWEGDLLAGNHGSYLATLVDRLTRFTVLIGVPGKGSAALIGALRRRTMTLPAELKRTLTWDLARASTHWLRHTFGRHAMAGGVQANIVQAVLGHASPATTTRYTSADSDEAWDAVQKFTKKRL